MKKLAIVIPCKNEILRLRPCAFFEAVERWPFLCFCFVDDGSTDGTTELLSFLQQNSPSIDAVFLPENRGKAEAVRAGMNFLFNKTDLEWVGFWDADLATPLEEIPRFLETVEKNPRCDAVIGARWPHLGARIERSLFRGFTGMVMKALIRIVLRCSVFDTQCGAKIFRKEVAEEIFADPFISRWLFDVELLKRMGCTRLRKNVIEQPLQDWNEVPGSKLHFLDECRVFFDLAKIERRYNT